MRMNFILVASRILLALTFLIACVHKILYPEAFALSIFRYQLLPHGAINLLAITLPWLELVVAVAILFSYRFREAATALILILLGLFTAAMLISIARGLDVSCGCFASNDAPMSWANVLRNLGYMFLAAIVFWDARSRKRGGEGLMNLRAF